MQAIPPMGLPAPLPLYSAAATRAIESTALAQQADPHALMERAGLAVCRWGRALYPHAQSVWIACGPGNNGGDGLVAARHWQAALGSHGRVTVTWQGDPAHQPTSAQRAMALALAAGVQVAPHPPAHADVVVDAIWGVGLQAHRPWPGHLQDWVQRINHGPWPVLAVDLPSGLDSDTGAWLGPLEAQPVAGGDQPRHTLTLLTPKPGLWMADGRDAAGDIWWDSLGVQPGTTPVIAYLNQTPPPQGRHRVHGAHKGSHGDVAILGGQDLANSGVDMTGAAVLAARAALRAGAGRVYVGLLAPQTPPPVTTWDPLHPELMFRTPGAMFEGGIPRHATLVCGCGGGEAVATWLGLALAHPGPLVLDADGLNHVALNPDMQRALAERAARQRWTVVTPHPLEAARLLGWDTPQVQANRLKAAQTLTQKLQAVVVLKGSGTVVTAPDTTPWINPTGNALLSTAGTGDVVAGQVGAALAAAPPTGFADVLLTTRAAVYRHGLAANRWNQSHPMTASDIC